jgi:hypothetical protein
MSGRNAIQAIAIAKRSKSMQMERYYPQVVKTHLIAQILASQSPQVVSLSELDDWEECSPGDADCELVEIDEDDEEGDEDDEVSYEQLASSYMHRSWQKFVLNTPSKVKEYAQTFFLS